MHQFPQNNQEYGLIIYAKARMSNAKASNAKTRPIIITTRLS